MVAITPGRDELASLLDVDPDIGADIRQEDWEIARQACRGVHVRTPAGRWELPLPARRAARWWAS